MITLIQLQGPFSKDSNILAPFVEKGKITHLAVTSRYNHIKEVKEAVIDEKNVVTSYIHRSFVLKDTENKEITIAMNKMNILDYELEDYIIKSLVFNQDEGSGTIITFDLEEEEVKLNGTSTDSTDN